MLNQANAYIYSCLEEHCVDHGRLGELGRQPGTWRLKMKGRSGLRSGLEYRSGLDPNSNRQTTRREGSGETRRPIDLLAMKRELKNNKALWLFRQPSYDLLLWILNLRFSPDLVEFS
ncbi:hypothetical protein L6452_28088 [Arctium lappa]|uniref:Uncharacterized protein n=1 Tax=Arctium lappa TaxID=4217 RepID=A0ACB8ZWH3_ARCLA|nr:hypothetical protein L6452_28088 [Arctium lappa]